MRSVRVATAARLHLGFLDLNGGLGRRFGSIGLSIDAFETRLEIVAGGEFQTLGYERERSAALALRVAERLGLDPGGSLTVASAIPAHSGLGSGTQLALAIASGLRRLHGLGDDAVEDARILDRGRRSGAGAALFKRGGFVLDVGRGAHTDVPPVVTHLSFPEAWRIVLIIDPAVEGVHGDDERRAFAELPPLPAAPAGEICRRTLMQILPGVAEGDLDAVRRRRRSDTGDPRRPLCASPGRRPLHQRRGRPRRRALAGSRRARRRTELLGTDGFRLRRRSGRSRIPRIPRARGGRRQCFRQDLRGAQSWRRDRRVRQREPPLTGRKTWPRTSCTW